MPFLAKRTAALAAVLATAAVVVPAATAGAADPVDPSYEQACPSWYGTLNPLIGCMPHARQQLYDWLRAHDPSSPDAFVFRFASF